MDAKKCDRCGKFYTRETGEKYGVIFKGKRDDYGMLGGKSDGDLYDLCNDCMTDFERWIKNEDTETAADA